MSNKICRILVCLHRETQGIQQIHLTLFSLKNVFILLTKLVFILEIKWYMVVKNAKEQNCVTLFDLLYLLLILPHHFPDVTTVMVCCDFVCDYSHIHLFPFNVIILSQL
jgi:hypothetical protein